MNAIKNMFKVPAPDSFPLNTAIMTSIADLRD